jgi:hypothetical protein
VILVPNEIAWLALNVAGLDGGQAFHATAIALGESGGRTDAIGQVPTSPNRDLGLWQISSKWHADKLVRFRWRDPYDNARMMRLVFDAAGQRWIPWNVYRSGAWEAHADAAWLAMSAPWEPPPAQAGWRVKAGT